MDANPPVELEGQTSINDLLDEPVGTIPVQPALPIQFPREVAARPVSGDPR
ncbi:hypothetical protein [Pseudarthrobacter albicanus]|uniref:hypothetical protein n=1 Tax=Pseudarthrobacter albicanus TaxID=2823873 RepID=UPI001BA6BD20|nr:hypothetical protein [Pseudarthrobacter albicanus]